MKELKIKGPDLGPVGRKTKMLLTRLALVAACGAVAVLAGSLIRAAGDVSLYQAGIIPLRGVERVMTDQNNALIVPPLLTMWSRILGDWVGLPLLIGGALAVVGSAVGAVIVFVEDMDNSGN